MKKTQNKTRLTITHLCQTVLTGPEVRGRKKKKGGATFAKPSWPVLKPARPVACYPVLAPSKLAWPVPALPAPACQLAGLGTGHAPLRSQPTRRLPRSDKTGLGSLATC